MRKRGLKQKGDRGKEGATIPMKPHMCKVGRVCSGNPQKERGRIYPLSWTSKQYGLKHREAVFDLNRLKTEKRECGSGYGPRNGG